MAYNSSVKLNILQNEEDFKLKPVSQQALIFKFGLIKKILNPPKDNSNDINNFRTVTIKCLFKVYK
jgi:hypothetical protein